MAEGAEGAPARDHVASVTGANRISSSGRSRPDWRLIYMRTFALRPGVRPGRAAKAEPGALTPGQRRRRRRLDQIRLNSATHRRCSAQVQRITRITHDDSWPTVQRARSRLRRR